MKTEEVNYYFCPINYEEKIKWCESNLDKTKWNFVYPWFEFKDEPEYTLFLLRWS